LLIVLTFTRFSPLSSWRAKLDGQVLVSLERQLLLSSRSIDQPLKSRCLPLSRRLHWDPERRIPKPPSVDLCSCASAPNVTLQVILVFCSSYFAILLILMFHKPPIGSAHSIRRTSPQIPLESRPKQHRAPPTIRTSSKLLLLQPYPGPNPDLSMANSEFPIHHFFLPLHPRLPRKHCRWPGWSLTPSLHSPHTYHSMPGLTHPCLPQRHLLSPQIPPLHRVRSPLSQNFVPLCRPFIFTVINWLVYFCCSVRWI
jgi:hypothetical protein